MIKNNLENQPLLYQLIFFHSQTKNKLFLDMALTALKCGADIDKANEDGETPLHLATKLEDMTAYRFLIQNGADIYARTKSGETVSDFCWQQTINQMANKWRMPRIITSHKNNSFTLKTPHIKQ